MTIGDGACKRYVFHYRTSNRPVPAPHNLRVVSQL